MLDDDPWTYRFWKDEYIRTGDDFAFRAMLRALEPIEYETVSF